MYENNLFLKQINNKYKLHQTAQTEPARKDEIFSS